MDNVEEKTRFTTETENQTPNTSEGLPVTNTRQDAEFQDSGVSPPAATYWSRISSEDEDLQSMPAHVRPTPDIGSNREEPVASTSGNTGSDGGGAGLQNGKLRVSPEYWSKICSSEIFRMPVLTQEQISVLRAIDPDALFKFLLEEFRSRNAKPKRRIRSLLCAFCKKNGEDPRMYTSHALKDRYGRVLCPILQNYFCPRCGATGQLAHTISYCTENW